MQDHYAVLGIPRTATVDDVKKAFRKLSLKYHPDKTPNKEHHALFIQISNAYETLKSPSSKATYDSQLGIHHPFTTNGHTSSTSTSTHTTSNGYGSSFSYFKHATASPNAFRPGAGYYGFYQHVYGRKDDGQRKAEEERARFQAEQLKKEMLERARAEEKIRLMQEREQARKMQERAAERNKENSRPKHLDEESTNTVDSSVSSESPFIQEELNKQSYGPNDTRGTNSSDPIVLEDDEVRRSDEETFYSVSSDSDERLPRGERRESLKKDFKVKLESEEADEVEEVPEPPKPPGTPFKFSDIDYNNEEVKARMNDVFDHGMPVRPRQDPFKRRSLSPKRTPVRPNVSYTRKDDAQSTKRQKYSTNPFQFDDFQKDLGVDIDNVDFKDIFNSLPNENNEEEDSESTETDGVPKANGHGRKISASVANKPKRPKLSEYYDGTSKADTLSTPINKKYVKGHSMDAVNELYVRFDVQPPLPPLSHLNPSTSKEGWLEYVASIEEYQRQFSNYRKSVAEYQVERIRRDDENFNKIKTETLSFETYQKCLSRDLEVQQELTESQREYNSTMNVYKQNCRWVTARPFK